MEDSLVDNEEEYLDHDSLSSESVSKDSLQNGHNKEESPKVPVENVRRGSYTLETSPEMSQSIRNQQSLEPIYVQTNNDHPLYLEQKSSDRSSRPNGSQKDNMSQSMYDRPWINSGRNSILSSANNKVREEKIRLAKEEQQRKQKEKITVLNENEKMSQIVRKRKESELQKKIDENKRRTLERQRIVDERKERLSKAEEARRKTILRKLVNSSGKKSSPQSSNGLMTMSCFGGFGSARTKPGNKEVVHNRFINARPVSSTGKVIGFGSSTPRYICENSTKGYLENKKIPESILLRCEILSRPVSSKMSNKMMTSVISPLVTSNVLIKPKRQSSFKEKKTSKEVPKTMTMTTSMTDFPSSNKLRVHNNNVVVPEFNVSIKEEMSIDTAHSNKLVSNSKRGIVAENKSSSTLSSSVKRSDVNGNYGKTIKSKSGTFQIHMRKTKVDSHLDSDSIEEELHVNRKPKKATQSMKSEQSSDSPSVEVQIKSKVLDKSFIVQQEESNSQANRAIPTKDLTESDYKARIMENRRLAREKREKEREQQMKSEREKRHADEIAAREIIEIERENVTSVEDTHLVTSNDDTLDGPVDIHEENEERDAEEEAQLSEITEAPSITQSEPPQQFNKIEDEKNERKKRLDLIMSRIRKPNDESSSEGGISPRRAMSPEPAELEPEINSITSAPAFRSSLLQSMMNKGGRLAKSPQQNKDEKEATMGKNLESTEISSFSIKEQVEEREDISSPTLSMQAPNLHREDCDGKEDSLSINDHIDEQKDLNGVNVESNKIINSSSLSSTETEEDENIKAPFEIDSMYSSSNINPIVQETCVFQN